VPAHPDDSVEYPQRLQGLVEATRAVGRNMRQYIGKIVSAQSAGFLGVAVRQRQDSVDRFNCTVEKFQAVRVVLD
jgi:hypothetical protein